MKSYTNLYPKLCSYKNLERAFKKAKKNKSYMPYVKEFEQDLINNIIQLKKELQNFTYKPKPLKTFIIRDPKTRKISKSDFRDRIVHHALINVIEPIFDKTFIYDSYANRKNKGTLKALERFDYFKRKVSKNGKLIKNAKNNNQVKGYCLKADIKHYFEEVDHSILINIIKRKIDDTRLIWLINLILKNFQNKEKGMPLGNLTSQFFANVYLNELDYFVKHTLKAKYYIRYVDDFVILHKNKEILEIYKNELNDFINKELKLELHPDKSKIKNLSNGIDFVGYNILYYFKLLRKRNIRKILLRINQYKDRQITQEKFLAIFQGWQAYAIWGNTYKLRKNIIRELKHHLPNTDAKYLNQVFII